MPEAEFRAAATTVIENYGNYEEAMEQALAENSVDVLQEIAAPVMQPALDNYRHQLFLARVEINELQAAGVAHYNQEYLNELNDFAAEMAINQPVPNEVLVFKAHYQERVQYFFDVYNAGYDYDRAFVIIDLLVTTAILLAALAGELDNDSGDDGSPQQGNLDTSSLTPNRLFNSSDGTLP